MGFPGGISGKEPACQCSRYKSCRFDPWVGNIPWRRAWQLTSVFLPGESHGQRSLVGYRLQGCKKSDMTEAMQHTHTHAYIFIYTSIYGCIRNTPKQKYTHIEIHTHTHTTHTHTQISICECTRNIPSSLGHFLDWVIYFLQRRHTDG